MTETPRNKGGRPRLEADEKRVPFTIRMTPFAIEEIKRCAAEDGEDASAWARDKLRAACARHKPKHGGRAVP